MPATPSQTIDCTIPVLAVADVKASIRFYCDVLDFKRDWGGEGDTSHIASVSRDRHHIMLQRASPIAPGCVWIGISGLSSLWKKLRAGGNVPIVRPPTNEYWALDMKIKDPDGNILWFGTETLKDIPFGQEVTDDQLPEP